MARNPLSGGSRLHASQLRLLRNFVAGVAVVQSRAVRRRTPVPGPTGFSPPAPPGARGRDAGRGGPAPRAPARRQIAESEWTNCAGRRADSRAPGSPAAAEADGTDQRAAAAGPQGHAADESAQAARPESGGPAPRWIPALGHARISGQRGNGNPGSAVLAREPVLR